MKKFAYLIMVLLFIVGIYLLVDYSNKKSVSEEFYTLPEGRGYVIDEGRRMEFNIYSNNKDSLIALTNMNSYKLKTTDININLENVKVDKFMVPGATLYKIGSDVCDITNSELTSNCTLLIENSSFKVELDIGTISFLKPSEYKLLDFKAISPSGSYINKHLNIVGFNLRLKGDYKHLESLRCGEFAYGRLNEALDSEQKPIIDIKGIIPSYDPLGIKKGSCDINGSIFIPIAYKSLLQLKESYLVLEIDNTKYYIDTFPFDSGTIDFLEYKDIMKKGDVIYA